MKGRGEKTNKLMSLQRKVLLGVIKRYIIISHETVILIAGLISLDLMEAGMDNDGSKRK